MEEVYREEIDHDNTEDLIFQAREWYSTDYDENDEKKEFHIYCFGSTKEGHSVSLDIIGFTPFFYLKVPFSWEDHHVKAFERWLKKRIGYMENGEWIAQESALISCKLFKKKDVYGFNNLKKFNFIRLVFNNYTLLKKCKNKFLYENKSVKERWPDIKFSLYNANVDPILSFTYIRNVLTAGWIKIKKTKYHIPDIPFSQCQINAVALWSWIDPLDEHTIAPFLTMSYDIECMSSTGKFPDPSLLDDQVIQIGSSFQRYGSTKMTKVVQVLGECDPIEEVIVEVFKTEKELIEGWIDLVKQSDPDQLIGYNIFGFDWNYLVKRAEMCDCEDALKMLSRIDHCPATFQRKEMSSNAYGDNKFNYMDTIGIGQIDLLHIIKREHKLTSYKLDNVSKLFLGDKKDDVTPAQIFAMAGPNGTSSERAIVANYCAQDTALPLRLMTRLSILPNLLEMAKVTRVPVLWLITRGQQIKVFSQLVYECRKEGFLIPTLKREENAQTKEKFQGATVLGAQRGAYFIPIAGLDFASLYPSIMIAHNLCFSTFVREPRYDNIDKVKYLHKKWEGGDYKFVQSTEGLLPRILKRLWGERKVAKKQMFNAKTPEERAIYNGKQLAIKVTMNSIYGFCGSSKGILPCKPIASTVTTIGREMIEHSKTCAETWYDGSEDCGGVSCKVRYGDTDSIYCEFSLPNQDKMPHEILMKEQFRVATECADQISETFIKPIELEMEKVMYPFFLFSKKRYACLYYEKPEKPKGIDCKGIQVVRRDNCPLVKDICNPILDKLMYDKDIPGAEQIARENIKKLMDGEIEIDKLVLSKSLRGHYKDTNKNGRPLSKPAHWHLVEKMKIRDPMTAPKGGDRVPYIFIENDDKDALQCDRVEDPKYAKAHPHTCKPDTLYYLERQLQSPLITLFELIVTDRDGNIFPDTKEGTKQAAKEVGKRLWDDMKLKKKNRKAGNREITNFFPKKM